MSKQHGYFEVVERGSVRLLQWPNDSDKGQALKGYHVQRIFTNFPTLPICYGNHSKQLTGIENLTYFNLQESSQNAPLVGATLETLLRFLNWIPLGYIFETKLINTLIYKVKPIIIVLQACCILIHKFSSFSECPCSAT